MRLKWFSALFLFFLYMPSFQAINLVIDYSFFAIEGKKPYLELYLSINGNSISYANTKEDLYQAKIEVTYILEKDSQVVAFEKFQLNSPEYKLEDAKFDLIDLKRFPLENETYNFSFKIVDLTTGDETSSSQVLRPEGFDSSRVFISGIQLANQIVPANGGNSDFIKSNVEVLPNFSHSYKAHQNQLSFYAEIYNTDKVLGENEAYVVECMVVKPNSERVAANIRYLKRRTAKQTEILTSSFNIEQLPSGSYDLLVQVKNRENQLIANRRINFHRINPVLNDYSVQKIENTFVDSITNINQLKEYIRSLRPISSFEEIQFAENQLAYANLEFMQRFFLNFWKSRDPENPEEEWEQYKEKLLLVDQKFGYGNVKGYTTERGRVYLQYGPPNTVQNVPYEPDAYPYSIWQYYKLQGLTDRKFVFYSPSMEMLGYEILHSNVRGEINNPGWEADLMSGANPNRRSNREDPGNTIINDRARDLFNNPR